MKDKEFGIPEQKKFPLDTKDHVLSAIRFFNYADPAYEKQLASSIIAKIKEYGITGLIPNTTNRFYKYYNPKDYVEHHGIIGMKHGVRNGPPYPLGAKEHSSVVKTASKEEIAEARARGGGVIESTHTQNSKPHNKRKLSWRQRRRAKKNLKKAREAAAQKRLDEKEKERLVKEGSAEEIFNRKNDFSEEQKRRAISRLQMDQQLQQLSDNERRNKKSKVDKLINGMDKASKIIGTTVTIADNVKKFSSMFDDNDEVEIEKARQKAKRKAIESGSREALDEFRTELTGKEWAEANVVRKEQAANDAYMNALRNKKKRKEYEEYEKRAAESMRAASIDMADRIKRGEYRDAETFIAGYIEDKHAK